MDSLPPKVQHLLFSATIPEWIKNSMKKLNNPVTIDLIGSARISTPETVKHFKVSMLTNKQRIVAAAQIIRNHDCKTIVFSETKTECQNLSQHPIFTSCGTVKAIHGDLTQNSRNEILEAFRNNQIKILVATDVAARGLDIKEVELVINMEPARDAESYVHRSGRCGRAGNDGYCYTLVHSQDETGNLIKAERYIKQKIPEAKITVVHDSAIEAVIAATPEENVNEYIPLAKKLLETNSVRNLAAALSVIGKQYGKGYSLITGEKGVTTLSVSSTTPQLQYSLSEVVQFLESLDVSVDRESLHRTRDEQVVFDVPSSQVSQLLAAKPLEC